MEFNLIRSKRMDINNLIQLKGDCVLVQQTSLKGNLLMLST